MTKTKNFNLLSILLIIISFSLIQIELKSQNNNKEGLLKTEQKFDGLWLGPGNITLIKQLEGYVILQGNDKISSWSAKGIIKQNQLICHGYGVTNTGNHFVYESIMTLENNFLVDKWNATFTNGKVLEGKDNLKLITLDELQKKNQESR